MSAPKGSLNTSKTSVTSFLTNVFSRDVASGIRCYRGQSVVQWTLKPSVMRDMRPNAESSIFQELMVEAPAEFSTDRSMFDKLVRAQHYSLPTRLLDVSLNPLVGLYFACNEERYHDKDGVVHLLDFMPERVKFADSDTVSLICNLSRLSDAEREVIFKEVFAHNGNWTPKHIEHFRQLPQVKRLVQFIRVEKPYFIDGINPPDLIRYFFVHPSKNNRRVIAQSGAFVAAGLLKYIAPGIGSAFKRTFIKIPAAAKPNILKELGLLNINSRSMFPEIEFSAKYIRQKWTNGV